MIKYEDIPESLRTPSITRPKDIIQEKYEEISLTESLEGFFEVREKDEK